MPVPAPQPSSSGGPRTRKSFSPQSSGLRPIFTHARPSATRHTTSLLLPCNATANLLTPTGSIKSITSVSNETEDQTTAVSISPAGTHAVLALRSGRVDLIQIPECRTLRSLRPFQDRAVVSQIAFDESAAYVAFLSADGNVRVHDVENGDPTHIFRNVAAGVLLSAIAFHPVPSAAALLLGAEDGSVLSCNLNKKNAAPKVLAKLHVASVVSFAFTNDASILVTASADKLLCFAKWNNPNNGKLVACGESLVSVVRPGDESCNIVLSLGEHGVIRRWYADKAREDVNGSVTLPFVTKQTTEAENRESSDDEDDTQAQVVPTSMTMCGPNELVISLSDHTLLYVPVDSKGILSPVRKVVCGNLEEIYDLRGLPSRDLTEKSDATMDQDFALASNSSTVWVMRAPAASMEAIGADQKLAVPDTKEAEQSCSPWSCHAALQGHTGIILCVDSLISFKGVGKGNHSDAYLATSSRDKSARVWRRSRRTGKWKCMALAEGHTDSVGAVAISPRAAAGQFCIVTGAADRTIKLWSLDLAQKAAEREERERQEQSEEESNGQKEAQSPHWDESEEGDKISKLSAKWTCLAHEKDVNAVAISPDVQLVATGSQDRTVKIWDTAKGKVRAVCKGHRRGVWSVAFSNVDRIIASGSADATVRIWSVANGTCLRSFQGHLSGVLRCSFITTGTQVASAGGDGLIKIWATRTGECITTLDAHEDRAWGLDKIGDGDVLVSGGADGLVRMWRDTTEMDAAAEMAKRDEEALMEQEVQNAARAGRWSAAAKGALKLGMNQKLRGVIMDLISKSESPHDELMKMIQGIHDDEESQGEEDSSSELITKLFLCCRDWNASGGAKNAAIAAHVLQALFSIWTPEQLCDSLNIDKRPLVEALEAHCARHLERVSAFAGKIRVLEHTLEQMHALGKIDSVEDELTRKKRMEPGKEASHEEEKRKEIERRKRRKREEHPADY